MKNLNILAKYFELWLVRMRVRRIMLIVIKLCNENSKKRNS